MKKQSHHMWKWRIETNAVVNEEPKCLRGRGGVRVEGGDIHMSIVYSNIERGTLGG